MKEFSNFIFCLKITFLSLISWLCKCKQFQISTLARGGLMIALFKYLWPARTWQEKLLDLGQNKPWTEEALQQACRSAWKFWCEHGLASPSVPEGQPPPSTPNARQLVSRCGWILSRPKRGDAPQRNQVLANLLGISSPKTLQNILSQPWRWDRRELWWLHTLADPSALNPSYFLFHERTRASLCAFWETAAPSLESALLLAGLLALFQHSRPTQEARANRGQTKPRRWTPKAIAALETPLIDARQAELLLAYCVDLRQTDRADDAYKLACLVFECLLFQAHLKPHPPTADTKCSPSALPLCLNLLERPGVALLLREHAALFRARLARMRAYEEKRSCTPQERLAWPDHPYLQASEHLEWIYQHRQDPPADALRERLLCLKRLHDEDLPGLAMLAPQILRKVRRIHAVQETYS